MRGKNTHFTFTVVENANIVVRSQQDENGKEAWEDTEENPVGYTGEGKR